MSLLQTQKKIEDFTESRQYMNSNISYKFSPVGVKSEQVHDTITNGNSLRMTNKSTSMESPSAGIPEEVPQEYKDQLGSLQTQIKILLQNHQVSY